MKTKFNKKKIAISITAVTLVVATLMSMFGAALAAEDRSLEYIELLKQKYTDSYFKILEIAPTDEDGVFGYYVGNSEPIANWRDQAAMISTPAAREVYVNNLLDGLVDKDVLSTTANTTPLYLEKRYDEFYPWEVTDVSKYNTLKLDTEEQVTVRGEIEPTEPGEGDYTASVSYVPAETTYKNYFDYSLWRATLGIPLKEKLGSEYETGKYQSSKILIPNKDSKTVTVFGSTQSNWDYFEAIDGSSVFYDLASVYASNNYYTLELSDTNEGTYSVSFDVNAKNGRGQIDIIPLDKDGNNISYSPNYSKQYWYRSECVSTGHYEYQFTVPANSKVKYIQVKFDVENLEANAVFSNINIYKFNKNYFDINSWSYYDGNVKNEGNKISVTTGKDKGYYAYSGPTSNQYQDDYKKIECSKNSLYTLTYHVENKAGATSKVLVYGYDENYKLITEPLVTNEKVSSGTYSISFNSKNAKYLYVFPIAKTTKSWEKCAVYSNISLTRTHDFVLDESEATHVQVIDHFESGEIEYDFGNTIFDFNGWYTSSSNDKSLDSAKEASVSADNEYQTITITGNGKTVTSEKYKSSEKIYYIPVEEGESYVLSYAVNNSNGMPHKVNLIFSDDKKNIVYKNVKEQTAKTSGFEEYSYEFTVGEGVKWLQVGFENTDENQRCVYSNISINKKAKAEAFYYNVKFTPAGELDSIADGTHLYIPKYEVVGQKGKYTMTEGVTYYAYDKYRDEYYEITKDTVLEDGADIYRFTGIYDYVGKKGEEGKSFNIRYSYYTAEINYDGYAKIEDTSSLGVGSVYYIKNGAVYQENIVTQATKFDGKKEYYVKANVVSATRDMAHPYWVTSEEFVKTDDHPLFKQISDGFTYVGEGKGDYKFNYDPAGKTELVVNVSEVYFEGGYKNNEWFKKYVFDVEEEDLDNFKASVTVVSPEYLNKLDEETLKLYLQGYELYVLSYGGINGKAEYNEDISDTVKEAIRKEALDEWGTEDDENFQYEIPVIIDNRICNCNKPNLKALAKALCSDITASGGVKGYIYKFDSSDVGSSGSIVNNNFFKDIGSLKYSSSDKPYYEAYYELVYENYIREANKNKYNNISEIISEAAIIRYIINYRGQRPQHIKSTIEILEIQPYTEVSELRETNGDVKTMVKKWFSTDGNLMYVDDDGNAKPVTINITTQSVAETGAKKDDIIEKYDVIYVGTSKDNLDIVTNTKTGLRLDDEGHEIPDYNDDQLDGCYYTSIGDKVKTGEGNLKRSELAGLVGTDYTAIRSLHKEVTILGKTISLYDFSGVKDTILDLWWIDDSTCELRLSGNDITKNVQNQLENFAKAGKPIIYSDELVENEFIGSFSVDLSGEVYGWTSEDGSWCPQIRLIADLVLEDGTKLPEGVEPYFTWHFVQREGKYDDSWTENGGKIRREDWDHDGINEGICEYVFHDGKKSREFGTFYVEVTFKFSGKRYKGLKDASILSNDLTIGIDEIFYNLKITSSNTGYKNLSATAEITIDYEKSKARGVDNPYLPSESRGNDVRITWRSVQFLDTKFHMKNNGPITYQVFDKDGNVVSTDYKNPTDKGVKIVSHATFNDVSSVNKVKGYKISVQVDDNDGDTLVTWDYTATDEIRKSKIENGSVWYYKFTKNTNGVHGATVSTQSGIAINNDRYDTSSYMYIATHNIFKNNLNVFSEEQLTTNQNRSDYVKKLLMYANLSQPEIVIMTAPTSYPTSLTNLSLDFTFRIDNYTDDDLASTRYEYKFYVDNNADGKFSEDELTDASVYGVKNASMSDGYLKASSEQRVNEYKFYKKFPESTAGIIPWQLKVVEHKKNSEDTAAEYVHSSIIGYAYVRPANAIELDVLQVLPVSWKPNYVYNKINTLLSDYYFGSVFLCSVFDDSTITSTVKRTIYYKDGTTSTSYNDKDPDYVKFEIGDDFILNIHFTNVDELNGWGDEEGKLKTEFAKYDMMILGYADSFGNHKQNGTTTYLGALTNEGFQQGVCKEIENFIDSGKSLLLTHDTLSNSNNYVGYITNDILNTASDTISTIVDFFTKIFGSESEQQKLSANLHSSRVKQGYYANICLRAKFGQDRYGVTAALKDRILTRDSYETYSQISYDNQNLRHAHDYVSMYSSKTLFEGDNQIFNVTDADAAKYIKKYSDAGYKIDYVPNTNRAQVEPYFQGYTDFEVFRFQNGENTAVEMTDVATKTNSGQITNYPFVLGDTLSIFPTHPQHYQVSLETDIQGNGVTVWYCLGTPSGKIDFNISDKAVPLDDFRNDATNAYYIYSNGNVTYTGSGHTNYFTVDEAKLFINTIVASYRITSEKPIIKYTDSKGEQIDYQLLATSSDDNQTTAAEDGLIYFKLKDTSVNTEATKALSVRFYRTKTVNESTGEVTYSDPVTDLSSESVTVTDAASGDKSFSGSGNTFAEGADVVKGVKGDTVYSINVPDSVKTQLAADDNNEVSLYAVVVSTPTSKLNGAEMKSTVGDPVELKIRELNLRTLY